MFLFSCKPTDREGDRWGVRGTGALEIDPGPEDDNGSGRMAFLGDVNGDSYDDVMITREVRNVRVDKTLVYFGRQATGWTTTWGPGDFTIDSPQLSSHRVSPAGDVNGDGRTDLLMSAEGYRHGRRAAGAVYLAYGRSSMPDSLPISQADVMFAGDASYTQVGDEFDGGGDFNGDGHPDILLGGEPQVPPGSDEGLHGYLFFGPIH